MLFRGNLYKNKILNLFYWNTVGLQCYINFCYTENWFRFIYVQICIYSNIYTYIHTHTPQFISVQFSCSVVSTSLWSHESHHARPSCPSPTPRVHSDSNPMSQWCHPAISSSVISCSSCPQSLPASESFPMNQQKTNIS